MYKFFTSAFWWTNYIHNVDPIFWTLYQAIGEVTANKVHHLPNNNPQILFCSSSVEKRPPKLSQFSTARNKITYI